MNKVLLGLSVSASLLLAGTLANFIENANQGWSIGGQDEAIFNTPSLLDKKVLEAWYFKNNIWYANSGLQTQLDKLKEKGIPIFTELEEHSAIWIFKDIKPTSENSTNSSTGIGLSEDFILSLEANKWHMIATSSTIDDMSFFNNKSIDIIWTYSNGEWSSYNPTTYNQENGSIIEFIPPNQGFWVHTSDKILISSVSNKLSNRNISFTINLSKDTTNFTSVTVTDKNTKEALYFGKELSSEFVLDDYKSFQVEYCVQFPTYETCETSTLNPLMSGDTIQSSENIPTVPDMEIEEEKVVLTDAFLDTDTNLIWQDDIESATVSKPWITTTNYSNGNYNDTSGDTASSYCESLQLSGFTDWRLPTLNELTSLVNTNRSPAIKYGIENIAPTGRFGEYRNYWSLSTDVSNSKYASQVNFETGITSSDNKKYTAFVRCVRNNE
jgi:hypothetical protein